MKLSEFKNQLQLLKQLTIIDSSGNEIPTHFHITEAGLITKHFIDCGGTVRNEKVISFQIWVANDLDHRLTPEKLLNIISLSEPLFENEDVEIEIEYQGAATIEKYGISAKGKSFVLVNKQTNCLAKDHCGIPVEKLSLKLSELTPATASSCCTPGGGCC